MLKNMRDIGVKVAWCVLGLLVVTGIGYLALEASKNRVGLTTICPSGMISVDTSQFHLPNEWKVSSDGACCYFALTEITDIKYVEDLCEVSLAGHILEGGYEWPFVVVVCVESIRPDELYVSKLCALSVPQNVVLEEDMKSVSRLYFLHLQKTLLRQ